MLKKSLNYWSAPGGLEGSLDVFAFLKLAKVHRFPAVELAIGETGSLNLEATKDRCEEILAFAAEVGVAVDFLS
jgi:hypothetical protein